MAFFSIRNKLFLSFSLMALVALATGFYVTYTSEEKSLQETFTNELSNSTALIENLVQTVAKSSIENHLQAIAETQLSVVTTLYRQYQSGKYSEQEAKELAAALLLGQDVGSTGYIYCLNSKGRVTVHRDKAVQGSDVSSFAFVQAQLRLKNGYLEYSWKNPGEKALREKVMFMKYFPEWDWIISVSAYKSEFAYLIDINNISKALKKITFGKSGYPFILSADRQFIFHPELQGNVSDAELGKESMAVLEKILHMKTGMLYYNWVNSADKEPRKKIAIFKELESYHWYIGVSAYLDEIYAPLTLVKRIFLVIFLLYCVLSLLAAFGMSTLVTRPLQSLMRQLQKQNPAAITPLQGPFSNDETGLLARYLNKFIGELDGYHQRLQQEIAERQNSEKALKKSEQTFHTLFDNSFQFIALLDSDGCIIKVNKTALAFRNLRASDVEGKLFRDTPWWQDSPELLQQLDDAIFKVKATRQTVRFEIFSNRVREIYLDFSLKPFLDEDGNLLHIIAEAREVTEIRKAEQDLQQAQKMESIGLLAGGIAHDFNNALAGILGTLSLMQMKNNGPAPLAADELNRHLAMLEKAAVKAKNIVNQLLALSRKNNLEFKAVDLRPILDQVRMLAENSFDKSITIDAAIAGEFPVLADSSSLEQVFLNLYINAAHAMTIMRQDDERWGGTLQVQCKRVFRNDFKGLEAATYWCVAIRDEGVGIDVETMSKIFVPFFTTKGKGLGTGLGMAMAYNIVNQHRGRIEIDSQPGQGTTVKLFLPVWENGISADQTEEQENYVVGQGTILIIDDEKLIRETTGDFLEQCGYRVLLASNGQEGINLYTEHREEIDLVLLDLVMPGISGRETYTGLTLINPAVTVLLSSGFRKDERVEQILAAGANAFLQKPYSFSDLSRTLRLLLSSSRRYQEG